MNKSLRKLFSLALALALVFSSGLGVGTLTAQAEETTNKEFTDIANLTDAEKANIEFVVDRGIIKGHVDNTFRPNDSLTRRHAAMILAEELGLELLPYKGTFSDVTEARNGQAIEALVRAEIVSGYPDGTFKPEAPLQRVHFAKLVANAYNLEMGEKAVTLTDLEALGTDKTFVELVVSNGIVDGYPNGTFGGRNEVKRIHVAKFMTNTIEFVEAQELEELTVESVSAINAKTLEVTFNQAADVEAADFTVNKGTVKTNIASVALSEDETVATIELTSKMTKGEYTVTVAQEDADALVATVSVDDEKVSKIEVSTDVAPITSSSPSPYQAKVGVKVLNQYGEDITKFNHTDVTITVGGAATTGTLDLEGVLTLGLVTTAKEGDSIYLTLVHGKTGVVAQETVKVSRAAAISEITFGELYNKDGKTLTQDTNVTKDKFYLPINFKDQYGKEVTKLTDITGKVTLTNANPGVVTVSAVKTVKINNKDVNVLEVNSVNLAGSANIIAVSNTTGANATATLAVEGGVKVASISLGSPQELVTAGKDALFPLTIIDTAGNEIKTLKEYTNLVAKDSITVNGGSVVEVKDKGLFVKVLGTSGVVENQAITIVITSSTGKVATQTVVPKEAAKATVITGISSKKATALRLADTVVIENKDLIVEDQFGQIIKDETVLAGITFELTDDPTGVFNITNDSSANKKYTIGVVSPIADPDIKSSKLTFKILVGGTANEASAYTKTFSVVEDSQFASYEVEDVKTIYAAEGDGTPGKDKGKFYVDARYNQNIVVKAKTSAGEVVGLTKGTDFTVVGQPANDAEVKFAKDAKEAKKTVTITINRTGEQLTKELTYSNVAPEVVDFIFTATSSSDANKAKALDIDLSATGGTFAVADLHTSKAKIVTTDQYGLKDFTTAIDTLTIVPADASKLTVTNNGTATAQVTAVSAATSFTAKVKIEGVTKEIKVNIAP